MFPSPDPRIYCLLQSADAHPALAGAAAPGGLLSLAEQALCDRFRVEKRRRDWLLGRWTAKHLVQSYLALVQGAFIPLDQLEIFADEDGAPYVRAPHLPEALGERLPLSLSISHSGHDSFCALCTSETGAVGADVEQIEPRENSFVRTFFTERENGSVDATDPTNHDAVITALWSTKEAVLKTLRLGLRADTRQVEVTLAELNGQWQAAHVSVDPVLLPQPSSKVSAWQQVHGSVALSVALLRD